MKFDAFRRMSWLFPVLALSPLLGGHQKVDWWSSCWDLERIPDQSLLRTPVFDFLVVDNLLSEISFKTKRSSQNASPIHPAMEETSSTMTETPQAVSIPTILNIVNSISNSDQCLYADAKLSEYINLTPQIVFHSQEEKNNYATEFYTIQEEVRSKFNTIKQEELRIENEK
ncbi:hypothetical protein NPIL_390111 [Nephila pilipes]|uniref:Spider venom protein n=1 Tax=Nephila pilipes TaxID=299642 RepID=A0A8X6QY05_NEPPI|nr:hypothetical protein NPIL_390111 [Nephila pilipes]